VKVKKNKGKKIGAVGVRGQCQALSGGITGAKKGMEFVIRAHQGQAIAISKEFLSDTDTNGNKNWWFRWGLSMGGKAAQQLHSR